MRLEMVESKSVLLAQLDSRFDRWGSCGVHSLVNALSFSFKFDENLAKEIRDLAVVSCMSRDFAGISEPFVKAGLVSISLMECFTADSTSLKKAISLLDVGKFFLVFLVEYKTGFRHYISLVKEEADDMCLLDSFGKFVKEGEALVYEEKEPSVLKVDTETMLILLRQPRPCIKAWFGVNILRNINS